MPKSPTKTQRERMSRIVDAGCLVCRLFQGVWSPASIHHVTTGRKRNHDDTIALCAQHHQLGGTGVAIHANRVLWEKKYGTQDELLEATDAHSGNRSR
jgi:hypothetical protein